MAREQLINTAEDMEWLRDVHLRGLARVYKSAVVVGNEDSPEKILVFGKKVPRYDDPGVVFRPDAEGKFHVAPGGLAPGGGGGGGAKSRASTKGRPMEPSRGEMKRRACIAVYNRYLHSRGYSPMNHDVDYKNGWFYYDGTPERRPDLIRRAEELLEAGTLPFFDGRANTYFIEG